MKLRRIDYLRNRFRPNCFAASLLFTLCLPTLAPLNLRAQQLPIGISSDATARAITITAAGRPFATFIYPDTLAKPVLYPIYAPDGQLITRGFPLNPRPGEPVDHPHHVGLWLNYENVNGLDFWNNSYAIPAAKRSQYGWIRTDSVGAFTSVLRYSARWTDQQGQTLLNELTTFHFSATANERFIDRLTILTAVA